MINSFATWLNVMILMQRKRNVLHTQNPANNNKKLFIEYAATEENLNYPRRSTSRTEAIKYPV